MNPSDSQVRSQCVVTQGKNDNDYYATEDGKSESNVTVQVFNDQARSMSILPKNKFKNNANVDVQSQATAIVNTTSKQRRNVQSFTYDPRDDKQQSAKNDLDEIDETAT